jgi:hypothetical protein
MIRVRPRDSKAPFYAPSADITNFLPKILGIALHIYDEQEDKQAILEFTGELVDHLKKAKHPEASWDTTVDGLFNALNKLPPEEAIKILSLFFFAVMDWYWHCMRLVTDSPELDINDMQTSLIQSMLIRRMPEDIREKYLEHCRTHNMLADVIDQPGYGDITKQSAEYLKPIPIKFS